MDPNHWRYKKNKEAGIIERAKQAEEEEKKGDVIKYSVPTEDKEVSQKKTVKATHDDLKALNREEQVLICKAMKLRGYSELNEEALISKILIAYRATKRERKGVTTIATIRKKKVKKKTEIVDDAKRK